VSDLSLRAPVSDADWDAYYELRWRILRAPWQAQGPGRDETDATSLHRMLCDAQGNALAVGRLHRVDARQGQIRYMAVDDACRRRGHGSLLLAELEQAAREMQLESIILQAREGALPFYRRHGYSIVEKSFLLFDEIQHYLMHKPINS